MASFLLSDGADRFTAALATDPGDFRVADSWPPAAPRPGRALVVMNDPLQFEPQRRGDSYMDPHDFKILASNVSERYLERPALTVNVGFCSSNPGRADRYQALTESLTTAWSGAFSRGGEYRLVGVKWGSFMIFVAACNNGAPWVDPTFPEAFTTLENRIRTGLNIAHQSDVAFYRSTCC